MTATTRATTGIRTWIGFSLMCLGMFMAVLDVQIVATALPTIEVALHLRLDQMSWVQSAYLTAEVTAIPLTGIAIRILSMRRLFVIAISVFTIASLGCALSQGFTSLIVCRVVQGFSGGVLIPVVFSAVFLLFPKRWEGVATTIAGLLAVLAPTVGPVVGGWITQTYSWRWLFLINLAPGVLVAAATLWALPREKGDRSLAAKLDLIGLVLLGVSLSGLEIGLKEGPERGWTSPLVLSLLSGSVIAAIAFIARSLRTSHPLVQLRTFKRRNFAVGCAMSGVLGVGLFGSTYLMPVFLAFVRGHNALQIGLIMLATGAAQLVSAPVAVALERRVDARLLAGLGFLAFGVGLGLSAIQPADADFKTMFWPQVLRGAAIMFCLLPPTRLALGELDLADVPDASGLFNLMRNLGGAIGLSLIDTVLFGRVPVHASAIASRLQQGDLATAKAVGIPLALFQAQRGRAVDPAHLALLKPLVQRLATAEAVNDAWLLMASFTLMAVIALLFAAPGRNLGVHAA